MRNRSDRWVALLMLLPSIILLAIFVYYFIFRTVQLSMTDWGENPAKPAFAENVELSWVGLDNYENLMTNILEFRFRNSMVNTFFFTLFFLGGCILLGFLLAVMLDQRVKGEGIFRTIFLFPMALSFVVTGTIWRWMLQPAGGINVLPQKLLGLEPLDQTWINSRQIIWQFEWGDIPLYLTYLGIFLLAFAAFNYLSQENDLLGQLSAGLVVFVVVGVLAFLLLSILFGYDPQMPYYAAGVGAVAVLLHWFFLRDASGGGSGSSDRREEMLAPRRWRPISYMGVAALLLGLAYLGGLWDQLWPPLDNQPDISPKGYNVALSGIILAAVWQMSGYTMAMFLAGLRGIPDELREAARVDGASELRVYSSIILPLLRPIVLSAVIILGHISLKIFDLVWTMAGPDNAQTVVPGVLVYLGFRGNRFASSAAVAVVMLFLVALVIIPYLWSTLRQEVRR